MNREIVTACFPFLAAMLAAAVCLGLIVRLSGARWEPGRMAELHRDESGSIQSLSFVLTLPLFIMVLMFLVQMSQLAIGRVVVEYAAYAAARSAIVWIPANLGPGTEQENRISSLRPVSGSGFGFTAFEVEPAGKKYAKIHFAAAMACLAICPSREVGASRAHPGNKALAAILKSYFACARNSNTNAKIPRRLENKLAYALENTVVTIVIRHKYEEPELQQVYLEQPYPEEFTFNEIGWQDQILVTVTHDFALLPGPGRLLAGQSSRPIPPQPPSKPPPPPQGGEQRADSQRLGTPSAAASGRIRDRRGVFVYPLSATVRFNNEGEKPVLPYFQRSYGGESPGNIVPPSQADEPDFDL